MWLVCGLGNPGKSYKNTRHNLGFDSINYLIEKNNFIVKKTDKTKELFKGSFGDNDCLICKPMTFMNLSGGVIGKLVNYYKIPKSKIIIIHDDIDLAIGKIKIKIGGGSGGHNGITSIDSVIGKNYKRIRIGVGRPELKEFVSSFVLEKFNKDERKIIDKLIKLITKNFELVFKDESLFLTKLALEIKK